MEHDIDDEVLCYSLRPNLTVCNQLRFNALVVLVKDKNKITHYIMIFIDLLIPILTVREFVTKNDLALTLKIKTT